LLEALDETVLEMVHVTGDTVAEATRELESQLDRSFDPMTKEMVAEKFQEKLRALQDVQEERDMGEVDND